MLKGVIDAMPVLFLQIAETQTSAIDFTMTPHAASPNGLLTLGNVNFYAMDPWGNFSENLHTSPGEEKSPFGFQHPGRDPRDRIVETMAAKKRARKEGKKYVPKEYKLPNLPFEDMNDSIQIGGSNCIRLLKTTWFTERLDILPTFDGFFPRTTIPRTIVRHGG